MTQIRNIFIISLLLWGIKATAQKPALDGNAIERWTSVGNSEAITNDGKYVMYTLENTPFGNRTLVVQSTSGNWKKEFIGSGVGIFTNDSRKFLFKAGSDSLVIGECGKERVEYFSNIKSYALGISSAGQQWLICLKDEAAAMNVLEISNLKTGKKKQIDSVSSYFLHSSGKYMVLIKKMRLTEEQQIEYLKLGDEQSKKVWTGAGEVQSVIFNADGTYFSFLVEQEDEVTTIWSYDPSKEVAQKLLDDSVGDLKNESLQISGVNGYSSNNANLFITLFKQSSTSKSLTNPVMVNIWNYRDWELGPAKERSPIFNVLLPLNNSSLKILNDDATLSSRVGVGDWFTINAPDGFGAGKTYRSVSFVSGKSGKQFSPGLEKSVINNRGFSFSPAEDYLLYYDTSKNGYYSYEITTGIKNDVSKTATIQWTALRKFSKFPGLILGWQLGTSFVFVQDGYSDIWRLDASGKFAPVCITNEYAKKKHVNFIITGSVFKESIFSEKTVFTLVTNNKLTKKTGYFRKHINSPGDPEVIVMSDHIYEKCIKAGNSEIYLVKRMDAITSSNYYVTRDFKSFAPLSNIHPERKYNWLSCELLNYQLRGGDAGQALLYKPENFDSRKQYPVIFTYYENMTINLNSFIQPAYANANINIPWYVSHGYVVVAPDITNGWGRPGDAALECIMSAADYITKLPFVDSTKMAIQGHSFGGYETNYILTHTDRFAAAVSAAGVSDLISDYGDLFGPGLLDKQWYYEIGQGKFGVKLWDDPDLYLHHSPIMSANKVSTPLLLMHSTNDGAVPFRQSIELYMALRQYQKPVWLLEYENDGHTLDIEINQKDYTIRMQQFFDYYLKAAPAPKWMAKGNIVKGIDTGLELDNE